LLIAVLFSVRVDDWDVQATRLGVYGMSYPFSPRYSASYLQDAPSNYTLRSVMFGGMSSFCSST
jgi:hypothetical protein